MKKLFSVKLLPLALLLSLSLITSCSKKPTLVGRPVNQYGGGGRTNDYEMFGSFFSAGKKFVDKPVSSDSSGAIVKPLVMNDRELVFATKKGSVILTTLKDTVSAFRLDDNEYVASDMCGDSAQNYYVITNLGRIISFDIKGKKRWEYNISDKNSEYAIYSALLATKEGIVTAVDNGYILCLSFDGKLRWEHKFTLTPTLMFAADENDNIAIPLSNLKFGATDSLALIDGKGHLKWEIAFNGTRLIGNSVITGNRIFLPAIKSDSSKNNSNKTPLIFCVDTTGKILWQKETPYTPRNISADKDAHTYVMSYDLTLGKDFSNINCFDENGRDMWNRSLDMKVISPLYIGEKNFAFTAIQNHSAGVIYLKRDGKGTFYKTQDLNGVPSIILDPIVLTESVMVFAGSNKMEFLRLDEIELEKMLPW